MAKAASIARGSWRRGSAKSPARCATASQPTKDSISRLAAVPIASHPCGAKGVQLSERAEGRALVTATSRSTASSAARPSWKRAVACRPRALDATTTTIIAAAAATAAGRPPPVRWAT